MIEPIKDEYVYLMTVHTFNNMGHTMDYDVIPFKSKADIKRAILNTIANNIKNNKNLINKITFDGDCELSYFAKIDYKSGISKTYEGKRHHINEVK